MGYNIGAKSVAIALLALTNGDRERADRVWAVLEGTDPFGVPDALDMVQAALNATADE